LLNSQFNKGGLLRSEIDLHSSRLGGALLHVKRRLRVD
jgi:hypothetical protein